jgi:hypothetical protein
MDRRSHFKVASGHFWQSTDSTLRQRRQCSVCDARLQHEFDSEDRRSPQVRATIVHVQHVFGRDV